MRTIWVATDTDEEGAWVQIVTYDPVDVIGFLLDYESAHVSQWELPDPSGGDFPEMVGP